MTEVLPRPRAIDAAVFTDVLSRTLTVRQAEPTSGYEKLLWTQAWQKLRRSHEAGWPLNGAPWVYADAPGSHGVVHGMPGDGGTLSFHWPVGTPGYGQLVGRPRLYAIATIDLGTHFFSTVKFLHRPG